MTNMERVIDMNERLWNMISDKNRNIERKQLKINELELSVRRYKILIDEKDSVIDGLQNLLHDNGDYDEDI